MGTHVAKKVLVVDDDEILLSAFRRALKREDVKVIATTDPVQARRLAKLENPNIAIVDLRIGSANGIELIRDLKRDEPGIQVALMSGYLSVATAVDAVKAGADVVVFKPVTPHEILKRLGDDASPVELDLEERPSLERVAYEHMARVLADCNGNLSKAARQLGIHRQSLQRRMKKPAPRK